MRRAGKIMSYRTKLSQEMKHAILVYERDSYIKRKLLQPENNSSEKL
jgi:hypothetical protein